MEAMVAMAIFVVGMSFVLLLFVSSSKGAIYSLEGTKASLISTQSMEAMRSILNDRGWLPVGTYEVGLKDDKEWDIISTEGLVGHWKLSGNARDYSGNGNDGTLMGGVTWAEDRMGQARGSAEFDGESGYVDCGNDESLNITDEITISAWVKGNAFDNYNFAVGKAVTYQLGAKSGKFMIRARFSGIGDTIVSGSTLTTDSWYHMVMTYDGNSFKGYLNGVSDIDSAINDTIIASANNLWISGEQVYSNYWSGQIDDVRIYNRALSEDEIKALYGHYSEKHQSKVTVGDGVTDGLVGYWPMNEGEGNYVYDYSPRTDNWGKFFGPYLDFDGVDDYVDVGDREDYKFRQNSFTLSTWIKTEGLDWEIIMNKRGSDSAWYRWSLNAGGHPNILTMEMSSSIYVFGNTNINDGNWHLVNFVRDGSDGFMYVDGQLDGSANVGTLDILESTPLYLGSHLSGGAYFSGFMDDARIYNRALSAEEISKLYRGEWVSDTGLVGHWEMDEGHGGQVRDKSGNGNHGTIYGATWGDNSPEWVDDVSGGALEFDGVDDYVNCGNDASLNITDAITIEAWVKPGSLPGNGALPNRIVHHNGKFSLYIGGSENPNGGACPVLYLYGSSSSQLNGNTPLEIGKWVHLVGVFNGADAILYINAGENARMNRTEALSSPTHNLYLGMDEDLASRFFNGTIDDVRIYNRALSEAEIQKIYEYGRTNKFYLSE